MDKEMKKLSVALVIAAVVAIGSWVLVMKTVMVYKNEFDSRGVKIQELKQDLNKLKQDLEKTNVL